MREQPVALYFDLEGGAERPPGFFVAGGFTAPGRALSTRTGISEHPALHSFSRLAAGCLPVCKLHMHVGLRFMTATDRKMTDALDAAFRTLLQVRIVQLRVLQSITKLRTCRARTHVLAVDLTGVRGSTLVRCAAQTAGIVCRANDACIAGALHAVTCQTWY